MNLGLCVYIVSFIIESPSGGKGPIKTVPANPMSHAKFRKNVPEAFKSCFGAAKRKIAKNAAHPLKTIWIYKTKTYPW